MTRGAAHAIMATGLFVIAVNLTPAIQGTPVQRAVKVARDSILCTSSASARQRRACARLDSIVTTTAVPDFDFVSVLFAAPGITPVAGDTVTVCARVERDGRAFVGYPAIRLTQLGDSAAFVTRFGNPVRRMCEGAFQAVGFPVPVDSVPVTWTAGWVRIGDGRRWLPFPVNVRP